jgi:uncharacterized membrane protein YfhO
VRRELYMPGWRASVNGSPAAVRRGESLLQTVQIPAGRSMVDFHFRPPHSNIAMIAFLGGVAAFGLRHPADRPAATPPHPGL